MKRKKEKGYMYKLALVWIIHFGNKDPYEVTCFDCEDYKNKLCEGGYCVYQCMEDKAKNVIVF